MEIICTQPHQVLRKNQQRAGTSSDLYRIVCGISRSRRGASLLVLVRSRVPLGASPDTTGVYFTEVQITEEAFEENTTRRRGQEGNLTQGRYSKKHACTFFASTPQHARKVRQLAADYCRSTPPASRNSPPYGRQKSKNQYLKQLSRVAPQISSTGAGSVLNNVARNSQTPHGVLRQESVWRELNALQGQHFRKQHVALLQYPHDTTTAWK